MPLDALSPGLRALYEEVDAIVSQPTPQLPRHGELTPEQAAVWDREHRGRWIDDVVARIARFPAAPSLTSDDEIRMAAALRGLALSELEWRLHRIADVHGWQLFRVLEERGEGVPPEAEIDRAVEARLHTFAIAHAAGDAFRACAGPQSLDDPSSWWAICREQLGGWPFELPPPIGVASYEHFTSPCAVPLPVRLRTPMGEPTGALHVVLADSVTLRARERNTLREVAAEWLRENAQREVASPAETDGAVARAAASCANPIDVSAWAGMGARDVASIGFDCELDEPEHIEPCTLELRTEHRRWTATIGLPITERSLRSAVARLREQDGARLLWSWPLGDGAPLPLALAQALSREHQVILADSVESASLAATSAAFAHCVREHGGREAVLDVCVDVAPDGSVSNPVVLSGDWRPIDRIASRAYRSAEGERARTPLDRCLLDVAARVRFPCITETTRVGSPIYVRVEDSGPM